MINSTEQKLDELDSVKRNQESNLQEFTLKRDTLLAKHKDLNNQQIISNEELTKIENDCYNIRAAMATIEAEIEEAENQLESNLTRKVQLNQEIKKLAVDTREAKKEIVKLNTEIEKSSIELSEVENKHQEKLDLLNVELDEKKIVEKEFKQKKKKLNEALAASQKTEDELNLVLLNKETLEEGIDKATRQKGELLIQRDELLGRLNKQREENKATRQLLEGVSIEINELRKECSLINDEFQEEINKTKTIVNSLEMLRGQARSLKAQRAQSRFEIKSVKEQAAPIMAEVENTQKQIKVEEVQSDLEIALSKIEFDASLYINENAVDRIKTAKYQKGLISYIESLPFVFSRIEFVKITLIQSGDLSVTVTGNLRCDEELTKELLKDNIKGKFTDGIRFKISDNSIRLVVVDNRKNLGVSI